MTWMVTGGAGYIGAHVVAALADSGRPVVALDDLSTGAAERVGGHPLVVASVLDTDAVRAALTEHRVTGVVHLAAKKQVGESVADPLLYYRENIGGLTSLLTACREGGVEQLVFSSSASVYGMPDVDLVDEETPCVPLSPYGETKLVGEWLMRDCVAAGQLRSIALRYFNVAGAGGPELGDPVCFNLIQIVLRGLLEGRRPQVFGGDYPTADGTCIRDYVHVVDLAQAHVAAAGALEAGGEPASFNIGRGAGYSVLDVLRVVGEVTGLDVAHDVVARRAGDPARVVASVDRARAALGFTATRDLPEMVASAWAAMQTDAGPGVRVLVTGAAGFIGSHLVDRLLADGHDVTGIDDLSTGKLANLAAARRRKGLSFSRFDVTADGLAALVAHDRPEVVCHLAAQMDVRVSVADPLRDARVNVLGTVNLLEACVRAGVRKVVFASSGGTIYGQPARLPVSERHGLAPGSPYGAAKAAGETYLAAFRRLHGLAYTSLALGNVYGPRQDPHGEAGVVAIFARALLAGEPTWIYGDGTSTRDYVYVDDVVDAFARALGPVADGRRLNVGTGVPVTVRALHAAVAAAVGGKDAPLFGPRRAGELQAIALDNGAARRALGWEPFTGLAEGLATTVEWVRAG